jgi:hypothetical protein
MLARSGAARALDQARSAAKGSVTARAQAAPRSAKCGPVAFSRSRRPSPTWAAVVTLVPELVTSMRDRWRVTRCSRTAGVVDDDQDCRSRRGSQPAKGGPCPAPGPARTAVPAAPRRSYAAMCESGSPRGPNRSTSAAGRREGQRVGAARAANPQSSAALGRPRRVRRSDRPAPPQVLVADERRLGLCALRTRPTMDADGKPTATAKQERARQANVLSAGCRPAPNSIDP